MSLKSGKNICHVNMKHKAIFYFLWISLLWTYTEQDKHMHQVHYTLARWNPKWRQESRKGFITFYNILHLKGAYVIHVCILIHMYVQVYTIHNYIIMYTELHIIIM